MNRTLALTLAAALSLGAAHAMAEDAAPAPVAAEAAAAHAKHDQMKRMSPEDMQKRHDEMFAKSDKDGDGALSRDEFQAAHMERADKAFDTIDANKDGKLSKEELKEGRKAWHKKMRGMKKPQ